MIAGLLPSRLPPRAQRLLALFCCACLLALLIWQVHDFLTHPASSDHAATPNPQAGSNNSDLRRPPNLAQYRLFGSRSETPVPIGNLARATASNDETIRLKGTLARDNPQAGKALIDTDEAGQKMYAVGAELPGSRILREVHADHVVIERNNQLSLLPLPRQGSGSRRPAGPTPATPAASQQRPSLLDSGALRVAAPTRALQLDKLDAAAIAQQVRPMVVKENGQVIGIRLQAGRDSTLLQQLGFRGGDVILAINGETIDSEMAGFRAARSIQGSSRATVVIRRDGREQTITVDASQINR